MLNLLRDHVYDLHLLFIFENLWETSQDTYLIFRMPLCLLYKQQSLLENNVAEIVKSQNERERNEMEKKGRK